MNAARAATRAPGVIDSAAEALRFFDGAHKIFLELLGTTETRADPIVELLDRAFELFERGVVRSTDDLDEIACHGGCASCCTIRVVATAPEILAIARSIRGMALEVELMGKIIAADRATRELDETQRWVQGLLCPFADRGLCVIYPVRPLACRGHASFDAQACIDSLSGHACEVPVSTLHMTVRSLVQNAMQSAMRDYGYAWGVYELNRALCLALADDTCEVAWIGGEDVFASALVADVSAEEMAAAFDALKVQSAPEG